MAGRLTIGYVQNGVLVPNATYAELFHLDRKELAAIAKRIFENANRRLINLRTHKINSEETDLTGYSKSASEILYSVGKRFSARGKTNGQLVSLIFQADNFLKQNDSTVRGALAKRKQELIDHPNMTEKESRIWARLNDKLREEFPRFFEYISRNKYGSEQYKNYAVSVFKSARGSVVGGLAGDIFAKEPRRITATAAEREKAINDAYIKIREKVKRENDALFPPVKIRGYKPSPKFSAKDLNTKIEIE